MRKLLLVPTFVALAACAAGNSPPGSGGNGGEAGASTSTSTSSSGAGGAGGASTSSSSTSTSSSGGPVSIGIYTYTAVPPTGMLNPPAAAWHHDDSMSWWRLRASRPAAGDRITAN